MQYLADESELVVDEYNRNRVGLACRVEPEEQEVREMLYIVAYDIAEPGRLRRVARVCEEFGLRVEKSVLECDLDEATFTQLWLALIDQIDEDEDAVVDYRLCRGCLGETESMGQVTRTTKRLLYIV
jgi:CRISPR-associated protein Cas2